MAESKTYAALLRGVNVGGKNKLPMGDLRQICGELELEGALTYVQSGNLVFRTTATAKETGSRIEGAIAERFGLEIAVLLRTHAELTKIAESAPFPADDPKKLHVLFLSDRPVAAAASSLDPERSPGDEFRLSGRELYLYYSNGSGRTKLTLDYFERRLGVSGTARNWNTLLKLAELTA
ncbi:MAG TPA: DUF1697 domain-containing protein [Gaiellaceae bacterium]|nr:DUF1697 domain-containing protein [Gaiellaceae bacterium]